MTFVPDVVGAVSSKWAKGTGGPSGDEAYNLLAGSWRDGGDVSHALDATQGQAIVAFTSKDAGGDAGEVAPTLRGGNHVNGNENGGVSPAVAFDAWDNRDSVPGEVADPLRGGGRVAVASETVVRRLTPLECERLQGLPDGHTAVPFRGRAVAADGNRYRAIGNGWAVPVVRWLFARLDRVHVGCQADG
jgi:DNA (cytosine-5)-methyltransferase 1